MKGRRFSVAALFRTTGGSIGLGLLLGCFSLCPAQGGLSGDSSSENGFSSLKIDVDLVLVSATVTDHSRRFVTGLEKQHFRIFEDKIEQEIRHFSNEDVPTSIGLLFDVSSSMGDKIARARDAAVAFLKT
ncbi:MAG: hypothetical protein OXI92_02245, partial [Acidobacteriota bacterium]|nr:hypothetical protein [Acidobacteriota bacterium]